MASRRSRANTTIVTRLGAVNEKLSDAEAKSRTPAVNPVALEARLQELEGIIANLRSSNYRAQQDEGIWDSRYVLQAGVPAPESGLSDGKGSTELRDAAYGVPTTDAERAALANGRVRWYNTTTNREETYYAVNGTAGLTAPGLHTSSFSAGWYGLPHTEWGGKSGPVTQAAAYRMNWARGISSGGTIDTSTHTSRIKIGMDGIYDVRGYMRGSSAGGAGEYAALGLDGSRDDFEGRANSGNTPGTMVGVWTHDHPAGENNFSTSYYTGQLYAGDLITFGPQTTGSTMLFGNQASSGALYVRRIS